MLLYDVIDGVAMLGVIAVILMRTYALEHSTVRPYTEAQGSRLLAHFLSEHHKTLIIRYGEILSVECYSKVHAMPKVRSTMLRPVV